MARFITGKQLEEEVYDVIFKASERLMILSPYIKLDDYFKKELFTKHLGNATLELIIGFGKNVDSPNKSFNREDFDYFKRFPNVKVVYIPQLHAKYYANEYTGIITSINLYDYSFKNNIEYGVLFASTFMGISKADQEAWSTSWDILESGTAVFIRIPQYKKKLLGRDYVGSKIIVDQTESLLTNKPLREIKLTEEDEEYIDVVQFKDRVSREEFEKNAFRKEKIDIPIRGIQRKLVSATAIGKIRNVPPARVTEFMRQKGLIVGDEITAEGLKMGLEKRHFKGTNYIAYPEDLHLINELH